MITLILEGKITPKARPRHYQGRVLTPLRYRLWKERAIRQLTTQWQGRGTLPTAKLIITLGAKGQRGDLDNIAGAILDGLVQSGVIVDDRLSCIPEISIKYLPHKSNQNLIMLG